MSCLRVSEVNEYARQALAQRFGSPVWVVGEIHGLKTHAKSGHVYFDLVEKGPDTNEAYIAKIACAFFQGSVAAWRRSLAANGFRDFDLASGMEVKLKAKVDLFVREGRYQLIVSEVDPTYTLGAIARIRAKTIELLKASGLLEKNRSLQLGPVPLRIGLVTSVDSAAYRDFTSIIQKSGFAVSVFVFDAHMQGDRAAGEVARGIRVLAAIEGLDVIAIVRGGGAKTDLIAFDDIGICMAIATCPVPVITGIGHEIDLSVADMVAHRCLVTPTDAARFLVSRFEEAWSFLEGSASLLEKSSLQTIDMASRALELACTRLALYARTRTQRMRSALESAAARFTAGASSTAALHTERLLGLARSLGHRASGCLREHAALLDSRSALLAGATRHVLYRGLAEFSATLDSRLRDLSQGIGVQLERLDRLERAANVLHPRHTLDRGYSLTLDSAGRVCTDARHVGLGASITTVLAHGRLHSKVERKEHADDEDAKEGQRIL